jgi:aminopeptidase N
MAVPSAAVAVPAPGAPGLGDPYYPLDGNGGYDVEHYAITIGYDPAGDRVTGTTVITAEATQDLSRFDLDFALTATKVTVNGTPAKSAVSGTELVVTPRRALTKGKRMVVTVSYTGVPSAVTVDGESPWTRMPGGAIAVNEPKIAPWWFPSNDHPQDKASYDIVTTVPAGLQVLSNGLLRSSATRGGKSTFHWRERKPMTTYLAFVAIGKYDITSGRTASGIPYVNAVAKDVGANGPAAKTSLAKTPEIIEWEAGVFGPYPFESVGGVVPERPFGFALENQTRPVYSPHFWDAGRNGDYVVVHELAHQWFGDSVSVHRWKDIWLNEGFASMAEWLYSEHVGDGTAQQVSDGYYAQYAADDPFWTVRIGDPGPTNQFDRAVYRRGAMTLQALRTRVGDPVFFRTLREWAAVEKYRNGSIEEFSALAERNSGQKLGTFFQTWLYTPSKPARTAENGLPPVGAAAARAGAPAALGHLAEAAAHGHSHD